MGRPLLCHEMKRVVRMAREFAGKFYGSAAWQNVRDNYVKAAGGLCERCYAKGKIVPGEIVHHKVHLEPENINDPEIALSFDNLELLCRDCHGQEHAKRKKRFKVDALGRVTVNED